MKFAVSDDASLRAVRPSDLAAYLRTHGWTEAGSLHGRATLYTWNDAELLVPAATHYADFTRRIAESLMILAAVEQRPEREIWRDVVNTRAPDVGAT